jgi:tRNA threonylcarbamoyladenosine biosynthesis protein TsaB
MDITPRMTQTPRTLLALDAAGSACAVALHRDGETVAQSVEPMRRGQAERLVPLIESVFAATDLTLGDLEAVGVTTGPGGFTGVRIGLATARGYGLGLGIPVVGISRFDLAAAALRGTLPVGHRLLVAIDARRAELGVQHFDASGRAQGAPFECHPADLAAGCAPAVPLVLAGDAAGVAAESLAAAGLTVRVAPGTAQGDPDLLARLAVAAYAGGGARGSAGAAPRPLYLRAPDVTLPGSGPAVPNANPTPREGAR